MPKICYVPRKFNTEAKRLVAEVDSITDRYRLQDLNLSLDS